MNEQQKNFLKNFAKKFKKLIDRDKHIGYTT